MPKRTFFYRLMGKNFLLAMLAVSFLWMNFPERAVAQLVGVIRWDAWGQGYIGDTFNSFLCPLKWHYRVPFYGSIISNTQVDIRADTQAVMDQEIAYAKAGGVDYFVFDRYQTMSVDPDVDRRPIHKGLELYLSSIHKADVKFAVNLCYCGGFIESEWPGEVSRLIDLFREPSYQKVLGGRPIVYIFQISGGGQTLQQVTAALDYLRSQTMSAGLQNPYLVYLGWVSNEGTLFDAISKYTTASWGAYYEAPYSSLASSNRSWWSSSGEKVVPPVNTGWDPRPRWEQWAPWDPEPTPTTYYKDATISEWQAHVKAALDFVKANPGTCEAQTIIIYAWNEFDEGGRQLCPYLDEGNARLNALAAAKGGSSNTPPSITAHPASVTVTVGQTATFSVSASGTSPLSYQWQKGQVNISGATSASYTTPATVLSDSGAKFRCVVTNSKGSAASNEATLTVTGQELVGNWKLDETGGTSAADSSGKGNTGTLSGSPAWSPSGGKIGGALGFDGTDDYVNYGTNGILNFSAGSAFTIAGWVKTTESYGPIISQRNSAEGGAIIEVAVGYDGVVTNAGSLMALVRQDAGASGYARVTGGTINDGFWHHVALKRNTSGGIELFLDGVSQGTNTGLQSAGAITTNLRAIGCERAWVQDSYGTADQRYLNGMVDDVRVYNYALSAPEIQALSNVVDTTPPGAPGTVRDGTGTTDMGSTTLITQLSANWTASADAESGISGYSYAIGTTAGGTNITNWTAIGNVLTATKTGLNLSVGTTYYFSVKAINGAGLTGSAANSNGQVVLSTATADTTPPGAPGTVRDGATAGTDASLTYSTTTLSANWTAAIDNESGIANYQFSIGTTPGGTQTSGWATIGNVLSVTKTGLGLSLGATYYFSVKAVNGVSLQSVATNSNGQYVNAVNTGDTTAPSSVAQVRDGNDTGVDTNVTYLTDELSANWTDSADAESGISRYLYAIGTAPGATNITNWKDNGALTEVTETGLTLTVGATYYFSVKAENGVGLQSAPANSNGQFVLSQDSQGPLISNVSAQGITNAGATITWKTDEPSTSRVEYGLNASYGSLTGEYLGMNTLHSVTLAGLLSTRQYHYRVISRDYAGNVCVSPDYVFTTLSTLNTQHSSNAYPNPCDFSNGEVIKFKVQSSEFKEVKIYTLTGKLVRKLTSQPGETEISWDGTNENNEKVTRGIYIYVLTNGSASKITGKLAVVR